jgi:hypothetical protein
MAPGYNNVAIRAMAKKPSKGTSKSRHRIKPQKGEIISAGVSHIVHYDITAVTNPRPASNNCFCSDDVQQPLPLIDFRLLRSISTSEEIPLKVARQHTVQAVV